MIKLEATNGTYTVYNEEIPQLGGIAFSSLEEACEQVGLEEWFNREIRSLYKNMEKHGFMPTFADTPKFRNDSMYGITIEDGKYQVVNSDIIVRFLAKGAL